MWRLRTTKMHEEKINQNGNKFEGTINSENHNISIFLSVNKIIPKENYKNIHVRIFDITAKELYYSVFEDNFGETFPKMRINIDFNMECKAPFILRIKDLNIERDYSFELSWTSVLG